MLSILKSAKQLFLKTEKILLIITCLLCSTGVLADKKLIIESKYGLIGSEIMVADELSAGNIKLLIQKEYRRYGYEEVGVTIGDKGQYLVDDMENVINKIEISGNSVYTKEQVIDELGLDRLFLRSGWKIQGLSLINGLNKIKKLYHDNGRPRVNIKSGVKNKTLFIDISEGGLIRVLETRIKSDINNIELFDRINETFIGGKVYSKARMESLLMDIKKYLDENGHVDGVINVENVEIGTSGVILDIEIKAGDVYKFGDVSLSGWELDNEYTYKHIRTGDVYNLNSVRLEVLELHKKNLFKSIIPDAIKVGGVVNVDIVLKKKKTGIIHGGATLTGENPTIYLKIKEDNFLNKGIVADFSLSRNKDSVELESKFKIDEESELNIGISDYSVIGGESRKYSLNWMEKKSNNGQYYGVGLVGYDNCSECGDFGVEIKYGLRWTRVDNNLDISEGNSGYIEAIGVMNEGDDNYFLNGNINNYTSFGDGIILKNNIFISGGVNGSYFEQKPNAFSLRGINQSGIIVDEDLSLIFRNKTDLYKKIDILGSKISMGPYIDIIGSKKDLENTKYAVGGSISFETGVGLVEMYYGTPFNKNNTMESVGGIILNNRF